MSFNKRLEKTVLDKYKNFSQFAEDIGLSNSLVRAYIRGDSEPKLSSCLMLAEFLNISPAWLAYGIEESNLANKKENDILDLMILIYERLDSWLDENKKVMDSDKKSLAAKIIYKKLKLKKLKELSKDEIVSSIDDFIEILEAA